MSNISSIRRVELSYGPKEKMNCLFKIVNIKKGKKGEHVYVQRK